MYNHAPENYVCPFCRIVQRIEGAGVLTTPADIVWQDGMVTAVIASHQWPNNPGHVLVVPNEHFENIYDLPLSFATAIHECVRRIALAMKTAYGCAGTSTRQHNEPAGNQDVWHYHVHVFPRYPDDQLYLTQRAQMDPARRAEFARILRVALA